jgi:hypothetical protein
MRTEVGLVAPLEYVYGVAWCGMVVPHTIPPRIVRTKRRDNSFFRLFFVVDVADVTQRSDKLSSHISSLPHTCSL